jgi:hypothetical protein
MGIIIGSRSGKRFTRLNWTRSMSRKTSVSRAADPAEMQHRGRVAISRINRSDIHVLGGKFLSEV